MEAADVTSFHPIEYHGNLLVTHSPVDEVERVADYVRGEAVDSTGVKKDETHPIGGGSELDNRVPKVIVEVHVVKGKYTTILVTEYYVTSYIV